MRSPDPLSFATFVYLLSFKCVSGLPELFARQSCDSLWCAYPEDFWNAVGVGAAWFINRAHDLFHLAPPETSPIPAPGKANPPATGTPTFTEPDSQIFLDELWPGHDCHAVSPGNTNLNPCERTTEQIIWSKSCEDTTQNVITGKILNGMDGQYKISTDPLCRLKDGVLFWLAELTQQQIATLKEQTSAVRAVTPNTPYEFEDLQRRSAGKKRTNAPARDKYRHLEKRVSLAVIKQDTADPSLSFLSTSPGKPNTDFKYAYFSEAGRGVRVYLIDTGLDRHNENFDHTHIEWIYTFDVLPLDVDPDGHGTCMASKIAGKTYGVAKEASLVIVKARPLVASFIDALGKVISDLQSIEGAGQETRGWTVINISGGWSDPSTENNPVTARIEELIKRLAEEFQAVLVASAGRDVDQEYRDIDLWPAILSLNYHIITVGAVQSVDGSDYGRIFPWSRGGEALTVAAPGNGLCASPNKQAYIWEGASFAGAVVSGLVAYFLSIPDLNTYFRAQANLPAAVKDYVKQMSYRRYQAQKSVWNGLDSTDPTTNYPQWQGLPINPRL